MQSASRRIRSLHVDGSLTEPKVARLTALRQNFEMFFSKVNLKDGLKAACMLLCLSFSLGLLGQASQPIQWHDASEWGAEGRAWGNEERTRWFDRLPARAEGVVTDAVWNLSRHSAGMMVRFQTDASSIHARWSLLSANLAMPHMPASGVSGLDLYARDERGQWRWAAATLPNQQAMETR